MTITFERIFDSIRQWAEVRCVMVQERQLPRGKAGEFNGVSVTMNREYNPEERVYYLAHALGSIVRWSSDKLGVQEMFDELRTATKNKRVDSARLERAIDRYCAFEAESSGFAVWLLSDRECDELIASYTNFMRADLEAMTEFHRHGRAPVWRIFFARWNDDVAHGRREVVPFIPKPIPPFRPAEIERQEILQQQSDDF